MARGRTLAPDTANPYVSLALPGVSEGERRVFSRPAPRDGDRRGARLRALRPGRRGAARGGDKGFLPRARARGSPAPRDVSRARLDLLPRGRGRRTARRAPRGGGPRRPRAPRARGDVLMAPESKAVAKYLARHAEPEAALADRIPGRFGHVLVVPAYGERESLFRLLASVPAGPDGPVLIVVVVNARSDSPAAVHEANRAAALRFERELPAPEVLSEGPAARLHDVPGGKLLRIDRACPGHFLPEGQGVGLARKIGNDLALALSRFGADLLRLAPQHRRRHGAPPRLLRADRAVRRRGDGGGRLLLRASVRRGSGPRARRTALRDLAPLLRARTRVGRLALRLPEHGQLPRHPGARLRRGPRVPPQERRRGLLRPRQARQDRRDRAPRGLRRSRSKAGLPTACPSEPGGPCAT